MSWNEYKISQELQAHSFKSMVFFAIKYNYSDPELYQVVAKLAEQLGTFVQYEAMEATEISRNLIRFRNKGTGEFDFTNAVVMTLMRNADTDNLQLLQEQFPLIWEELKARYNAVGAVIWLEDLDECLSWLGVQPSVFPDTPNKEQWLKEAAEQHLSASEEHKAQFMMSIALLAQLLHLPVQSEIKQVKLDPSSPSRIIIVVEHPDLPIAKPGEPVPFCQPVFSNETTELTGLVPKFESWGLGRGG